MPPSEDDQSRNDSDLWQERNEMARALERLDARLGVGRMTASAHHEDALGDRVSTTLRNTTVSPLREPMEKAPEYAGYCHTEVRKLLRVLDKKTFAPWSEEQFDNTIKEWLRVAIGAGYGKQTLQQAIWRLATPQIQRTIESARVIYTLN